MNKKFTILTANYNAGKYLKDWADSILIQSYRPLEVIFVEDGSTDKSLEIIKKISKEFGREGIDFKLVEPSQKLFCGSAYNLALRNATGSYSGVLDSDDMLKSSAVEFIVNIYEKYSDVAWIYTQYDKYNRKMDRVIKRGFCKHPGKNKTILQMEREHINTYGHWRTFSDRIMKNKNLFGAGLKCCVDKHLGIRLEEEGVGMYVDRVCYKYRTRSRGEKSIVFSYPLTRVRAEVVAEARRRRKGKKVYQILECKE